MGDLGWGRADRVGLEDQGFDRGRCSQSRASKCNLVCRADLECRQWEYTMLQRWTGRVDTLGPGLDNGTSLDNLGWVCRVNRRI